MTEPIDPMALPGSPQEVADAIAGDPAYGFAPNPARWVGAFSTAAAQADRDRWRVYVPFNDPAESMRRHARIGHLVHTACALVVAAANPNVHRGTVLDELVSRYGSR